MKLYEIDNKPVVRTRENSGVHYVAKLAIFDSRTGEIMREVANFDDSETINEIIREYPVRVKKSLDLTRDYCFIYKDKTAEMDTWYDHNHPYAIYVPQA